MSKQLVKNYTFNATSRTVTLSDFTTVRLDRLLLIGNATTGRLLYNFADPSVTATVSANVVTLASLPGGDANTDKLIVVYDALTDDPAYPDSATPVTGTRLDVPFSTGTAQAVATVDTSNYSWVSVQITGQGTSSTVTFQVSNDGSNWVSVALQASTASAAQTSTSSVTGLWHGPVYGKWFRLNVGGISAGTTAGVVSVFTVPRALPIHGGTQVGTWTVQAQASAQASGGYSYSNLTTAATTTVKGSAGTLHAINVNKLGAAGATVTVYDNTAASGTKIATIDAASAVRTFLFDAAFATGLTVVVAGSTPPDISVLYK